MKLYPTYLLFFCLGLTALVGSAQMPDEKPKEEVAEPLSWSLFQQKGLGYVIKTREGKYALWGGVIGFFSPFLFKIIAIAGIFLFSLIAGNKVKWRDVLSSLPSLLFFFMPSKISSFFFWAIIGIGLGFFFGKNGNAERILSSLKDIEKSRLASYEKQKIIKDFVARKESIPAFFGVVIGIASAVLFFLVSLAIAIIYLRIDNSSGNGIILVPILFVVGGIAVVLAFIFAIAGFIIGIVLGKKKALTILEAKGLKLI